MDRRDKGFSWKLRCIQLPSCSDGGCGATQVCRPEGSADFPAEITAARVLLRIPSLGVFRASEKLTLTKHAESRLLPNYKSYTSPDPVAVLFLKKYTSLGIFECVLTCLEIRILEVWFFFITVTCMYDVWGRVNMCHGMCWLSSPVFM